METMRDNIVTEPMKESPLRGEKGEIIKQNVFLLDSEAVPGAPYAAATWYHRTFTAPAEQHTHDADEYLSFIGGDPEHPEELNARVTIRLLDEDFTITKSCIIFIPAGTRHTEFSAYDIKRPFICFARCDVPKYSMNLEKEKANR